MWSECKHAIAAAAVESKKKASKADSSDDDSSSDEEDLNVRRDLLTSLSNPLVRIGTVGEFRKRYRYNIPMYRQFSESMCDLFIPQAV